VYGYTPPRQPEPGATRLRVCESEIDAYARLYPQLSRDEILAVMKSAGPLRVAVETELRRIAEPRARAASKVAR
jgi:hypothetical protein